jgi:hypothetical protein
VLRRLLVRLDNSAEHFVVTRHLGCIAACHGKSSPVRGSATPLPVLIYRGLLPTNLQLTRASKTAIPLRDTAFLGFGIATMGAGVLLAWSIAGGSMISHDYKEQTVDAHIAVLEVAFPRLADV